jgi:hypothetical protein
MSNVLGVIVLARNGDRVEYYQDPQNYGATFTETTALGEVRSNHALLHCEIQSHGLIFVARSNLTNLVPCCGQFISTKTLLHTSTT